jgi:hypothetical protein
MSISDIDYIKNQSLLRELYVLVPVEPVSKSNAWHKTKKETKLEEFIRRFLLTLPSRNNLLVKK